MSALISIIIPCYKQAPYLPDAIKSLVSQSYKNWECIIVNDGSPDNAAEVAEALAKSDPRVQVINQENQGVSAARNTGIKAAKGDVLQFLDADDMLDKDKLNVQMEFLSTHLEVDIVFGEARYFTTQNKELRDFGYYATDDSSNWIVDHWNAHGEILEKSLSNNLFPINCPLVRRSVFKQIGSWNEDLKAHEDWEFWIRCAAANIKMELLIQPNTLALIRMHPTSMTFDTTRMQQTEFDMRIIIGPLLKEPSLQILNVQNGLKAPRLLNSTDLLKPLTALGCANPSVSTIYAIICFYLVECSMSRFFLKAYKHYIPWPIQRFFIKLTTRI